MLPHLEVTRREKRKKRREVLKEGGREEGKKTLPRR